MNTELKTGAPTQGRIFQINASPGGTPKTPRRAAAVTAAGVTGDQQRETDVHGGPERALCLFSLDHILALQAEGHPIFPGALGENLTLSGLDWTQLKPGARLRLGNQVIVEITSFTSPCTTIKEYFVGGDYSRVSQKRHPGWSRLYARVVQPGEITAGQTVEILASDD